MASDEDGGSMEDPLEGGVREIGVSYRQGKRIRRVLRKKGIRGLVHGNRGRPAWNQIPEAVRQRVVKLSLDTYGAFNDTHFTKMLLEREGLVVSRERVRQIRREAGIGPKRKRRIRQHRKRRERKAQEGLIVIWDGSPHRKISQKRGRFYFLLQMPLRCKDQK